MTKFFKKYYKQLLKLILICLIVLSSTKVFAINIVYPKSPVAQINSSSSFFIGSADPNKTLKINGTVVNVHPSGGFAWSVPLNIGKNYFKIESGNEKKTYVIERKQYVSKNSFAPQFMAYPQKKIVRVSYKNAPLRSTPTDSGLNRLVHYQCNIPLTVDGEKNGFYRVVLNSQSYAWISKKHAQIDNSDTVNFSPVEYYYCELIEDEDFYVYKFYFADTVPFVIEESNPLVIKFYNVHLKKDNTYVQSIPLKQPLMGYGGEFEGNTFVMKIRKQPEIKEDKNTLKGIKIALDAGHGGQEYGAIGCLAHKEKDINLSITKYLKDELKSRGATVIMTRENDSELELQDRVRIAEENEAMILISVHNNALPDSLDPNRHRGTSVYYYYNQAKPLADSILTTMTTDLKTRNDKVRRQSFALARSTRCVAVLIEVAYMINPADNAMLINDEFRKNCAKSIAKGIENYLKNPAKKD